MVRIPDSLRPAIAALVKYHFWILAAIVPLLFLPAVFLANGTLGRAIASQKSIIDSHLSALRGVQGEPEHPNDRWIEVIEAQTAALRTGILGEWEGFWASQEPLRVWPPELGADFLAAIEAVESGRQKGMLDYLLQRYRNTVPELVRQLPARMGCRDLMGDPQGGQRGGGTQAVEPGPGGALDDGDSPEASLVLEPLIWRAEDQQKLFKTFVWQKVPSLPQVRLAQEELWVYGLLCDVIKRLNLGAKGSFDASITGVDELAIGYFAAEEALGGVGGGRIIWKVDPKAPSMGDEDEMDETPPIDEPGTETSRPWKPLTRPANLRFSPAADGSEAGRPGGRRPGRGDTDDEAAALTPEQAMRQWIYVDFAGRPLTGRAVETATDAAMTHLMPFRLRVVIDQRKIDRLLREFAENTIPIDVRQVRINPTNQSGRSAIPSAGRGGAVSLDTIGETAPGGTDRRRPYDVNLEIRGTIALATPPDPRLVGGGPKTDDGPGDAP